MDHHVILETQTYFILENNFKILTLLTLHVLQELSIPILGQDVSPLPGAGRQGGRSGGDEAPGGRGGGDRGAAGRYEQHLGAPLYAAPV